VRFAVPSPKHSRSTRQNPVTSAGYHLRAGQRVLWESDEGHYLLAYVEAADSTSARARRRIQEPHVLLLFPNGVQVITPLDRVHALPEHGPYRRSRSAQQPQRQRPQQPAARRVAEQQT
jgi:hypothetical protein